MASRQIAAPPNPKLVLNCIISRIYCLTIVGRPIMAAAAFPGGRTRWKAGPQAELPAPLNARSGLRC